MYSDNFPEVGIIEFHLDSIKFEKEHDWVNYPKGVLDVILKNGYNIERGFDIYIWQHTKWSWFIFLCFLRSINWSNDGYII